MATQLYTQGSRRKERNNDYSEQNKGRTQTERKHTQGNKAVPSDREQPSKNR